MNITVPQKLEKQ